MYLCSHSLRLLRLLDWWMIFSMIPIAFLFYLMGVHLSLFLDFIQCWVHFSTIPNCSSDFFHRSWPIAWHVLQTNASLCMNWQSRFCWGLSLPTLFFAYSPINQQSLNIPGLLKTSELHSSGIVIRWFIFPEDSVLQKVSILIRCDILAVYWAITSLEKYLVGAHFIVPTAQKIHI